jgi:TIR domain
MPSKANPASSDSAANVFVSYSRKDARFVDRLEKSLTTRGFSPMIDREEIYAFEDWWRRIEELIVKADTIVFVLSPDAVSSEICIKEVKFAASLKKRFAPIVCRPLGTAPVPDELARLNFIFFDDEAHFGEKSDELAQALLTNIDWIRKHTEFGALARRWSQASRRVAKGLLLRPPVLEEAEKWIASRPHNAPQPTKATQTFVAESRRAETRRRNILISGLSAGLMVALVLD